MKPDIIALGYDQEHAEERIRASLIDRGLGHIKVVRVEGLSDDLDDEKIIARILELSSARKE